ncbi:MAG: beta-lactamase family protein [Sphingomonadaceae bacterium]|nr:beta-lactamase family protein [Sphingomonadaceae bacterium]
MAAAGAAAVVPAGRAGAATIVAPGATPAFRAVLDRLAAFAAADLAAQGFPGMTLAVRAGDGPTATVAVGEAAIGRAMVGPDQLFQIGSISKSFVAMALYALAGQGRVDLDAPAVAVVPELWLEDRSITLTQLLSHSAGLPDDAPFFPDVPGGRLWSATPPGSHFSYSNAGYDMLALVVERASGERYDRALRRLVLAPLGMTAAEPVIRTADRARYAQGYVPFGDVAWFLKGALAEGPWLDIDRAAGSVAATPGAMLRYLAFLGSLAQGRGAPLFPDALARRFATPLIDTADFGKGGRYGQGLATVDLDGEATFHHTGGMLLFSSAFYLDRASGAGVFASVNIGGTGYRPRAVAQYGVRLLRASARGQALPAPPPVVTVAPVAQASDFAGRFVGPAGDAITFEANGTTLSLIDGARRGQVKPIGDGSFISDLRGRHEHALDFVAATGPRARLWYGGALYGRDAAVAQPAPEPALAALAGVYGSNDPWVGGAEAIVRGDTLVIDGGGPIHRAADGSWRYADPMSCERLWFDKPVAGRPERLVVSGNALLRQRT